MQAEQIKQEPTALVLPPGYSQLVIAPKKLVEYVEYYVASPLALAELLAWEEDDE